MSMRLTFHGAAGTVTGSCALLETTRGRMLVDCGLFQGTKTLRELNYGAFPFDPARVDIVLLTHAHIDHAGLLPKLARHGYGGRFLATLGTRDLLTYVLPDAGYVQESGVERLNRRRRHRRGSTISSWSRPMATASGRISRRTSGAGFCATRSPARSRPAATC